MRKGVRMGFVRGRAAAVFLVVALAAGVLVSAAASAPHHDGMLYGCAYVTNLGSSSNVDTLIWDKSAPGAHGWVMFTGAGINKTDKFTLDNRGWHTEPFHVTGFAKYHITVHLTLKPALSYSFDFTLNAANDVTSKSCKPH
jgi:hypothetical protein